METELSRHQTSRRWTTGALLTLIALPAFAITDAVENTLKPEPRHENVGELVTQFNQSQAEVEVKALFKGTYPEVLTSALAAYRRKNPPHLVQVYEVGTQTMLLSEAIVPVHRLMKQQRIAVDWGDFIEAITGYYSRNGELYSMPFNASTPILYYDKDVFNGDIGIIAGIDLLDQTLTVEFDRKEVRYELGELDELALAYAITIHKAQGSEFPAVVIPLAMQQYLLLQRNLIYTGITRGKSLVVLIGQQKALAMAVRNHRTQLRFSGLLERLKR